MCNIGLKPSFQSAVAQKQELKTSFLYLNCISIYGDLVCNCCKFKQYSISNMTQPLRLLIVCQPKLIMCHVRHFLLQACNYASSIKSYVEFLAKVDTIAPDALYGAKWCHLVPKT